MPLTISLTVYFLKSNGGFPEVGVTIAGGVCEKLTAVPGIRLLGQVENLAPVYRSATVVVNPVLFGTGLKIKTIEALGFGKALVTTKAGAEGMDDLAGKAFLVAGSDASFSDAVVSLLLDRGARLDLAESAYACAVAWNRGCMDELVSALSGHSAARNGMNSGSGGKEG